MGGMRFTRMNTLGSKLSKIDCIMVSHHFLKKWPSSNVLALTREFSNHSPPLLNSVNDYGPTPFKFYNSWLIHEDFNNIITNSWSSQSNSSDLSAVIFKNKLKNLKAAIKQWRLSINATETAVATELRQKILEIDRRAEVSPLSAADVESRTEQVKALTVLEHKNLKDLRQKAKVKWTLEGDENSGFFHGYINNHRNRSRLNGLAIDGSWTSDPTLIKPHIFHTFATKFQELNHNRPTFSSNLFKHLSDEHNLILENPFTHQEIKDAVWNCGSEKAPGPDGFSFKLIKKYWNLLSNDIISFVNEFHHSSHIPRGCNSSFITLAPKVEDPLIIGDYRPISLIGCQYKIIAKILANRLSLVIPSIIGEVQMAFIKGRQIIDGPLVVNEVISWAKKHKKKLLLFKVDFEKAFDTLSWSFLDSIMAQMGFGVEALNVVFLEARNKKYFIGAEIGVDKIPISHLQFADDALFIGQWSLANAKNLSSILTCFHLASGLKVNFNKSKLYGIGAHSNDLNLIASAIGATI
ncbi:putative RNA-directed DNA polymerase [Tanacetum coccineum]